LKAASVQYGRLTCHLQRSKPLGWPLLPISNNYLPRF
jgi:hypothetical protein